VTNKSTRTSIKQKAIISLFAGLSILLTFLAVYYIADLLEYGTVLASLGATAFLVFVYPEYDVSRFRNVIGGYILSSLSGSLARLLLSGFLPLAAAVSVSLSIFLMLILGFKHPPASGIALYFVLYSVSFKEVFSVLVGVALFLLLTELLVRATGVIRKIGSKAKSTIMKVDDKGKQ